MPIQPPNDEGPQEFAKDAWRVFRIVAEFVDGFESMTNLGPSVSIFGSARLSQQSPYYEMAMTVAQEIAKRGFAITTGGGPGLMEAANHGAQSVHGPSCGLTVDLPFETGPNSFIDPRFRLKFRYFFVRKVMFIRYAHGFVFLPGGFGTMDELFETLTLVQTKRIRSVPIFLMGKTYWTGLVDWIQKTIIEKGCASPEDINLLTCTDDPKEVADIIEQQYSQRQGLRNF